MLNKKKLKRWFAVSLSVILASILSYYFSHAEKFWMPLTAFLVMQTSIGFALRQGLQRFLIMALVVIVGTLLLQFLYFSWSFPAFYARLAARLYDVSLGAFVGIVINLVVFPRRVDVEFREDIIPLLSAFSDYLKSLFDLLLQKDHAAANAMNKKYIVEKQLLTFSPVWVYQKGFTIPFQQGHRHFLIMIERMEQILFSMHHVARHSFNHNFIEIFHEVLQAYLDSAQKIFEALILVLSLKKLPEGVSDLKDELLAIETLFQTTVPLSLELLDVTADYIYFSAWIADLNDLRLTFTRLGQALT